MKKTVNLDKMYTCKATTAIKWFFKSHPELEYWREQFEWMAESGTEFFTDDRMADGTKNPIWTYALHLDQYDGTHTYICIIERA